MHREISHTDEAFAEESNLPLYLMTGLLAVLLALDLLPRLGDWTGLTFLQVVPRELGTVFGFRITFATIAAILGGARIVYVSLHGLLDKKVGADLAIAIAFLAAIFIQEWLVAAEVVFIGMFGECLEAFTFDRTRRAIRKIVEVFPIRCWRLKDGAGRARLHQGFAGRRSRRRQAGSEDSGRWRRHRWALGGGHQPAHRRELADRQGAGRRGAGGLDQPQSGP